MRFSEYIQPKIHRKIIRFFLENPTCIDTSRAIATWINESVDDTERALKKLAEARILVLHGNDATPAYGYTTDARIISKIEIGLKGADIKKRKKRH